MKKRVLGAVLASVACLGVLASCTSDDVAKLQVVDKNGNVTEAQIKPTSDAEQVATAVEYALNAKQDEKTIKELKGVTLDGSVTAKAVMKDSIFSSILGSQTTSDAKATITATATAHAAVLFDETNPVFEASAKLDVKAEGSDSAAELAKSIPTGEALVFNQGTKVYANVSYKMGETTDTQKVFVDLKNENAEDETDEAYEPSYTEFDAEALASLKIELGSEILLDLGVSAEVVANFKETGYIEFTDDMHKALVDYCKKNEVAISNCTKDSFTLGMNEEIELSKTSKANVRVTVTLSNALLPLAITASSQDILPAAISSIAAIAGGFDSNITSNPLFASLISSNLSESSSVSANVKINYSAKVEQRSTDGYKEITMSDLEDLIEGLE